MRSQTGVLTHNTRLSNRFFTLDTWPTLSHTTRKAASRPSRNCESYPLIVIVDSPHRIATARCVISPATEGKTSMQTGWLESSTTSTWALPGSLEGPADDLHRIDGCGTVGSPLFGWIDYSPAEHTAAGHWSTTTGADGGDLFRRPYSPSVIHTYLHLHLWLQLIFTISIAASEDGVIFVPYVVSPVALLTYIIFALLSHCITVPALSESSLTAPRQIATSLSISHCTPPLLPTPKARTDDQGRTDRDPAKALSD
ncbi:hypothetical protein VE04_08449 [Pseudogymnoascus sp. 24MN13]|nr:hypothetical protein VE04_08449 [Pseudogymnoascus sp. 24MN13]